MTGMNRQNQPCGNCAKLARPCGQCRGERRVAAASSALLKTLEPINIEDRELLLAEVSGTGDLDTAGYKAARSAGANHDNVVSARHVGIDLRRYAAGLAGGVSHDDILAANIFGSAEDYIDARLSGATHTNISEVRQNNADLNVYAFYRHSGAPHPSALKEARRTQ